MKMTATSHHYMPFWKALLAILIFILVAAFIVKAAAQCASEDLACMSMP